MRLGPRPGPSTPPRASSTACAGCSRVRRARSGRGAGGDGYRAQAAARPSPRPTAVLEEIQQALGPGPRHSTRNAPSAGRARGVADVRPHASRTASRTGPARGDGDRALRSAATTSLSSPGPFSVDVNELCADAHPRDIRRDRSSIGPARPRPQRRPMPRPSLASSSPRRRLPASSTRSAAALSCPRRSFNPSVDDLRWKLQDACPHLRGRGGRRFPVGGRTRQPDGGTAQLAKPRSVRPLPQAAPWPPVASRSTTGLQDASRALGSVLAARPPHAQHDQPGVHEGPDGTPRSTASPSLCMGTRSPGHCSSATSADSPLT